MQRKAPVIYIAWILILCSCSETGIRDNYFNGSITYNYTYESKTMNIDSLYNERPRKAVFRYDSLNYLSRFYGKDTITYYYSGKINKALEEVNGSGNYTCEDYGQLTDSVISIKQYPANETVLGQQCDILEMQKKNSWVKYYVSREIKIAPPTYIHHKAYNMDLYGNKADGGLILKLEHRFKNFTMKGLASEISKKDRHYKAIEISAAVFDNLCK